MTEDVMSLGEHKSGRMVDGRCNMQGSLSNSMRRCRRCITRRLSTPQQSHRGIGQGSEVVHIHSISSPSHTTKIRPHSILTNETVDVLEVPVTCEFITD